MEVLIENYRGWDISFDSAREAFVVESDSWDQRNEKKSFAACKNFVDGYLKDNAEFKPIRIQHKSSGEELLLTGIRKDMRFIYEAEGKKEQLSYYHEKDYMVFNPDNIPIFQEIKMIREEARRLMAQANEIQKSISGKTLSDLKNELYPKQ